MANTLRVVTIDLRPPGRIGLTFFGLTVLGATDIKAPAALPVIAIGLVLTLIHLVGIPVTKHLGQPARSIGRPHLLWVEGLKPAGYLLSLLDWRAIAAAVYIGDAQTVK